MLHTGACPGGGGTPPLEIEKQIKSHQSKNFELFHLYFCYFCSRKYRFLCYFLSTAPLEKLISKKKPFRSSPPPYEFLDTPLAYKSI